MASNAQAIAITRALLALSTAVVQMRRALLLLEPGAKEGFAQHLDSADRAIDEVSPQLERLIELIEKRRE
jgi:hypothetical protein